MSSKPIRVLFADDHPIVRDGFAAMIAAERDMVSIGEVETGEEAIRLFRKQKPDVAVLDLKLSGIDAIAATLAIRSEFSSARIVILTIYDGDENIRSAIKAGVRGYVLKHAVRHELMQAIRIVNQGGRYFPPKVLEDLRDHTPAVLTDREKEILRHLADCKPNKEIAGALDISVHTVKIHVARILTKLEVKDRMQAVISALRRGIMQL